MVSNADIPYRKLPNQPEIFLQYLDPSSAIRRFYGRTPLLGNLGRDFIDTIISKSSPRSEIASILRKQNKDFGSGSETMQRIDALKHPDCVAIVTGQQVGLFTGPLYTLYKALTAIELSQALNEQGIRAVPVFWMESEDHDLAEATNLTVLDRDHVAHKIDYRDLLYGASPLSNQPVGSMIFPETIRGVVRDFTRHLPDFKWKGEVCAWLEAAYVPESTFCRSFAILFNKILSNSGLILFDPQDPQAKRLMAPLFDWTLENSAAIRSRIHARNIEIESAGLQPQVHTTDRSTILFYLEKSERCALEFHEERFCLKRKDRYFSLQQMKENLKSNPERFSPNVLLRPIVQDTLFPTLAYVAGPAEVAYFAQVQVLYALRNLPMPVLWPRESFTVVEPEIGRALQSLGMEIEDCIGTMDVLREKALPDRGSGLWSADIETFRQHLEKTLAELKETSSALDSSLPGTMDTARRKILYNIRKIEEQLQKAKEESNSAAVRTLDMLQHHCRPNGNLQERELNTLYFIAREGPAFLDIVRRCIRLKDFSHRILQME